MKCCIFYLPYELDPTASRARMVRPRKMIQAFKDIGYDVFEITGYAAERKRKIHEIKNMISTGSNFEFMYSEASTMPTLLTEPHHYPTHPFLDFGFFKYIKKHEIPIGLFYPDIYWKFDNYGTELAKWKRFFAIKNYELDIIEYEKYLDRFYVPTLKSCNYIGSKQLCAKAEELLPGAENISVSSKNYENRNFKEQPLTVLYVGGLGNHYQILELVKAISQTKYTRLIICCRLSDWVKEKDCFIPFLRDNISIIHKSGAELEEYYQETDICSLLFSRSTYMDMAKPVKAFEYLAHEIPVLSTKGTEIGSFIDKTDIGWNLDFDAIAISDFLKGVVVNPNCLEEKRAHCKDVKQDNLWTARAKQVAFELTKNTN